MCDPVSIAVLLATKIASTGLQNKAASRVAKARAEVMNRLDADLERNRSAANDSFKKSLQQSGAEQVQQNTNTAAAQRTEDYTDVVRQEDLLSTQQHGSEAAKAEIIKALGTGAQRSRDEATRRAFLDAYGDATLSRDITQNRAGLDINQQANFARGRQSYVPLELESANSAGEKYANMAGIVDALGSIGTAVYGMGAGQGWWGGTDPSTGIKWNTGRVVKAPAFGPVDPRAVGPFQYGSPNYLGVA